MDFASDVDFAIFVTISQWRKNDCLYASDTSIKDNMDTVTATARIIKLSVKTK